MFCTRCGTQLDDAANFCKHCGKPVREPGAASLPFTSEPPPLHAAWEPAPRRLRRIMAQKKIAGVCAGYAEYFNMDLTLMRLIWVVLLLTPPGIGAIAYVVSWIVLPKE